MPTATSSRSWLWLGGLASAMAAVVPMPNTEMTLLGRIYQPLSNFSVLDATKEQLTKTFDAALAAQMSEDYGAMYNDTAFSAQIFSLRTGEALWQYHYEAPALPPESYTKGKITEDSIYRIGSITKATTIYTWLVGLGDSNFYDPITKYIPELAEAESSYKNPIMSTNWSEVTIGALASQMSGIGRDFHLGDLTTPSFQSAPPDAAVGQGFPPLPNDTLVYCDSYGDTWPQCDRAQFLQGIIDHPPVNPAWYTPSYSNLAYAILGMAYESATGTHFDEAVDDIFVNQLGMTSTTFHAPKGDFDAVIPRNDSYALFSYDIGVQAAAGNQYTSSKDFRTWGHAIYTNKLLSAVQTRRWLMPVTSTSRWTSSVGAPWEIYRVALTTNPITNASRIVDAYTKGGNIGVYASSFGLIPDHEIGFSVLSTGDHPGAQESPIRAMMIDAYLNAIEVAMKDQAKETFTGTYRASNGLNSSVTLEVNEGPGVHVTSWISNGTEMMTNLYLSAYAEFRLVPSDLKYEENGITYHKYILQALFNEYGEENRGGDFWSVYNDYWVQADGFMYNNLATDSWVIGFDEDGMVQTIECQALRNVLTRE